MLLKQMMKFVFHRGGVGSASHASRADVKKKNSGAKGTRERGWKWASEASKRASEGLHVQGEEERRR